jgi:hypothetical protein
MNFAFEHHHSQQEISTRAHSQAGHLMPMFNAKEKLKKGAIKEEDIPYMQRGGSWDNTDVKGGEREREEKRFSFSRFQRMRSE